MPQHKLPQKVDKLTGTNLTNSVTFGNITNTAYSISAPSGITWPTNYNITLSKGNSNMENSIAGNIAQPYLNFSLIKANGGTIVQCRHEAYDRWEYYVIPESGKNFDKELGKIISMHLLKGQL